MTIETKYNIGDEVWCILDNEVQHCEITDIYIAIAGKYCELKCRFKSVLKTVEYKVSYGHIVAEYKLFPTKEELLKSL